MLEYIPKVLFYKSAYFEIHQHINYQEHYSTHLKIDLNSFSYTKLYDIIKK